MFYPLASANPVSVSNFFAYVEDRFVREYAGQRAAVSTCICALFHFEHSFVLAAAKLQKLRCACGLLTQPSRMRSRAGLSICGICSSPRNRLARGLLLIHSGVRARTERINILGSAPPYARLASECPGRLNMSATRREPQRGHFRRSESIEIRNAKPRVQTSVCRSRS